MGTSWDLSGGALCLDFANTLGDRPRGANEHLHGPDDLLDWARAAGVVDGAAAEELGEALRAEPERARRFFLRARGVRERLWRIFAAIAAGERPDPADLDAFNRDLARALAHARIESADRGFAWSWQEAAGRPDRLLWPVLRSAAALLTGEAGPRVKQCASETCSWLFVDASPGGRRRWCDMKSCGNRAKARRHYRRTKARAED